MVGGWADGGSLKRGWARLKMDTVRFGRSCKQVCRNCAVFVFQAALGGEMLFTNLKLVFQLAQGDKIGFVVGIILRGELADALLHGGQVHAQEGVDLLFVGEGYGQRGDVVGALLRGDDVGVVGFYVGGEA